MLDAQPMKSSPNMYTSDLTLRWSSKRGGRDSYYIAADHVIDLCHDGCFSNTFMDPEEHDMDEIDEELRLGIEVDEFEYETVEKEANEYLCDRCGKSMDDQYDHEISVDPRIVVEEQLRHSYDPTIFGENNYPSKDELTEVATRSPNEKISTHSRNRISFERKNSYHTCDSCVREVFGLEQTTSSGNAFVRSFNDLANGIIKTITLQ